MSFSALIKAERKKRGWSQEKLAKKLHISRTTLGKYEREEKVLDLNTLNSLSKLFHFPLIQCAYEDEKRIYRLKERYFLQLLRKEKHVYETLMDKPKQAIENLKLYVK